jgi:hypothetical protein
MRRRTHGMTLVELIVAGFIVLTVSSGIFVILNRAWESYDALLTQNMVQREARAALDLAVDAVRSIPLWDNVAGLTSIYLVTDKASAKLGTTDFRVLRQGKNLVRLNDAGATLARIRNVTRFEVAAVMRERDGSASGGVVWDEATPVKNDPSRGWKDPNLGKVALIQIGVTVRDPGGLYTSSLSTSVKVRNKFYAVAPPALE